MPKPSSPNCGVPTCWTGPYGNAKLAALFACAADLLAAKPIPVNDNQKSALAFDVANLAHGVGKVCQFSEHPVPRALFSLLAQRGLPVVAIYVNHAIRNQESGLHVFAKNGSHDHDQFGGQQCVTQSSLEVKYHDGCHTTYQLW